MPRKSTKKTKKEIVQPEPQVEEVEVQPEVEEKQVVQAPPVVSLPAGVLRKEVVDINGKKYNKFWRVDGTTDVELLE